MDKRFLDFRAAMTKTLCQLFLHLSNFFVWPHITVDSHLSHSCNISGIPLNLAQMSIWTRGSTGQGHCHCPKYTVVPNSRIHELIKAKLHTNVKVSDDILSKRSLWHHNVLQKHFFFLAIIQKLELRNRRGDCGHISPMYPPWNCTDCVDLLCCLV